MATTLTSWAQLIWETLQNDGIDSRAVFAKAGLNPALLSDPTGRYPTSGMHILWAEGQARYSKKDFGLAVGQRWHPTTFNALGFAWLASDNLYTALERLVRYAQLVNSGLVAELTSQGTVYQLRIQPHGDAHGAANLAGLTALMVMCRALLGPSFTPVELGLPAGSDSDSAAVEAFFGCRIHAKQTHSFLNIDRQQAHIHLPGANSQLALVNEKLALENLSRVTDSNIRARAGQAIAKRLPTGNVSEESVAAELALSTRSLQRRLSEENSSFKQLLDKVRRELAKHYLESGEHSFSEISYLLGYGDQPSFSRAFKRWFAMSPSQYRSAHNPGNIGKSGGAQF
ncbi:AraC family transcriptional regulator [Gilvimarinus sp. DA14]|uniref:AraC family transcriptional regulator n=1 Tax=Gilvimarinus sp. DA14 TaxID=2956798 RepID=UPI0020B82F3F|nr:AraC family transcriptional regulator [Gilvimarinus sp. DA14]UTF59148.1 AraC family transcriptional regulator [Gilvimarinus sp. DA14]